MYNIEHRHSEIILNTLNKIVKKWEYYKDFIADLSIVKNAEDYKNLLCNDGEYGGNVSLRHVSCLLSNDLFTVHYEDNTNSADYSTGNIVFHLLFSGDYNAGHFDVLQKKNFHTFKPCNAPSILKGTN